MRSDNELTVDERQQRSGKLSKNLIKKISILNVGVEKKFSLAMEKFQNKINKWKKSSKKYATANASRSQGKEQEGAAAKFKVSTVKNLNTNIDKTRVYAKFRGEDKQVFHIMKIFFLLRKIFRKCWANISQLEREKSWGRGSEQPVRSVCEA